MQTKTKKNNDYSYFSVEGKCKKCDKKLSVEIRYNHSEIFSDPIMAIIVQCTCRELSQIGTI